MARSKDTKHRSARRGVGRVLAWAYRSVMTVATAVVVGVLVASAFSDHLNPASFHYAAYLGIAFPVVALLAVAWTVVVALLRHWWMVGTMVVALAVCHDAMGRTMPLHVGDRKALTSRRTASGFDETVRVDTMRVLTWNTCATGELRLGDATTDVPVLDIVRRSGADVVCLQEYAFSRSASGHNEQQLRRLLADVYPYYHFECYSYRRAMGLALYSRHPIVSVERIDPDAKHYFSSVCYVLDIGGRHVAVVNNHLQSNAISRSGRAAYDDMVEHLEREQIEAVRRSVVRQYGRAIQQRAVQAARIASYVAQLGDVPTLVVGDLNDPPVSYTCHRLRRSASLADTWQEAGLGPGITYNRQHFWFRIDHMLHSAHLRPLAVHVLDQYEMSDHYPLMATFQLLPAPVAEP